jgi:protein TonB
VSARINDRPHLAFPLVSAEHLPLIGEAHPLRREFEKWLAAGHFVTVFVALTAFATWFLWQRSQIEVNAPPVRVVVELDNITSPPPIPRPEPEVPVQAAGPSAPNALPDPVPNPPDPNATISGQGDRGWLEGDGGPFSAVDSIVIAPHEAKADTFTAFDKGPVFLGAEPPVYPRIVRDAGIDGTVMVKVLVGRDGRVKEAIVIDGVPALHAAALTSAHTAVFEPALQGTRTVAVWVVIPVTFRLHRD